MFPALVARAFAAGIFALSPKPTLCVCFFCALATEAESRKAHFKALADSEIAWRQDALDEGIATEEEAATLGKRKNYRVLLMRVNITALYWPTPPFE